MKLKYRPEIDGLRAIAVIAVILYHSRVNFNGLELFKGGFIGVDIFFVISGYLITSIILKELFTTGTFSFTFFYERRIRRIMPVLLFIMLVSLPFAWKFILPSALIDFSKSIIYSLGFSSNFYFHFSGLEYGDSESFLKPFLHTWSLSVEEQYYIIFPIIIILILKISKKILAPILVFGFFLSLLFAHWSSIYQPSFSFYLFPTRGWELLSGSLLSYLEIKLNGRKKNEILALLLPGVGIILIFFSILFFDDRMIHPSIFTVIPVLGVSLVIWFSDKNDFFTKILSTRLFVGTGLISYSLYLWHYPIFSLIRISEFHLTVFFKVLLIFIIILLSIFSYFCIERPARNKNLDFKIILYLIISSILVLLTFNYLSLKKEGFKNRLHFPKILQKIEKNLNYRSISQDGLVCHDRLGDKGFCIFNQLPNNQGDIILLGDSLTDSLLKNFIEKIEKTKFRLIHMSYSSHLYLPNFVAFDENKKILKVSENHKYRKEYIKNNTNKNTYIIYYGDYNYFLGKRLKFDEEGKIIEYEINEKFSEIDKLNLSLKARNKNLKNKIKDTLKELAKDKKVLLIYPTPVSPKSIRDRIKENFINKKFVKDKDYYLSDNINYKKKIFEKYNYEISNFFNDLKIQNLFKIQMDHIFCPKDKCLFYDNNSAYFFDTVHPTYEGSKKINKVIFDEIDKIEKLN